MAIKISAGYRVFKTFNYILFFILSALAVLPFIHLLALSLSSGRAATGGDVVLLPVQPTFESYHYLWANKQFFISLMNSLARIGIGVVVNLVLVFITAYPLSKENSRFPQRTIYVWYLAITMFIGGGLIPTYIVVNMTGLMDKIWALIIPNAVGVWNIVLMLNFFRQVPKELEESAVIDGAGQWDILWKIYLPVSIPAIATILLFVMLGHWNSWFDGIIYLNRISKYPLQTYIASIVMDESAIEQMLMQGTNLTQQQLQRLASLNDKTVTAAQVFLGALPIIIVYPFLQKFFVKGLIVGSVKG